MQGRSKLKVWHSAMVRLRCRWVCFFSRQGFFPALYLILARDLLDQQLLIPTILMNTQGLK
jgi:hypothetical protein